MNQKITFLIIFILSVILISCKSSFTVVNTKDLKLNNEGIIYSLPKTKINISIEITEIHKQKGPFAEFTGLYFNSKNAITVNEIEYQITGISIKPVPFSDPDHFYSLNSGKNTSVNMVNLTPEGFPAGINLSDYQAEKVETEQKGISKSYKKNNQLNYGDFSLKSIRETQYDTLYKEVIRDSVLIKIPVIRKKTVYKSSKKQAKEIADILFLLRDDRNALLKGENDGDNFPDGIALKIMLKELNELEKQYMSMFTGREIKIEKTFEYEVIPENDDLEFNITNFSKEYGIIKDTLYKPITLKLYLNETVNNIQNYTDQFINEINLSNKPYKGFIYRIPADISAEIIYDENILFRKNIKISQLGSINIIPSNIFTEDISIEFYPQNGSLKRISKIKTD
ncbi:MAG: DUF4831 family protein [Bacteroidales bacterium]|nr:DUF4831 family protein [Bacteroidales bacterium]